MLSRLAAIWRVPELLRKILLTIGLLALAIGGTVAPIALLV